MSNAGRKHARLAGPGAGQHQHRAVERLDGGALLGIESPEIIRNVGKPPGPLRDAERGPSLSFAAG